MSEGPAESDSGLFGKLPRSRPGTRSPRRAAGAESPGAAAARPAATPSVEAPRSEPGPRPRPAADEPPAPAATPEEGGAGLEDLAWAGIAVTAEAATLGVRLFSRAIDAARKATERR
jgi:hypothetical protein